VQNVATARVCSDTFHSKYYSVIVLSLAFAAEPFY